jgi:hypothetical protein
MKAGICSSIECALLCLWKRYSALRTSFCPRRIHALISVTTLLA